MVGRRKLLGALSALVVGLVATRAGAAARYETHGTVRSFGKKRRYVNIAHDDIPGYMAAMTMSFEPANEHQLDGLAEGDKVAFSFTDDGQRRVLERIAKA